MDNSSLQDISLDEANVSNSYLSGIEEASYRAYAEYVFRERILPVVQKGEVQDTILNTLRGSPDIAPFTLLDTVQASLKKIRGPAQIPLMIVDGSAFGAVRWDYDHQTAMAFMFKRRLFGGFERRPLQQASLFVHEARHYRDLETFDQPTWAYRGAMEHQAAMAQAHYMVHASKTTPYIGNALFFAKKAVKAETEKEQIYWLSILTQQDLPLLYKGDSIIQKEILPAKDVNEFAAGMKQLSELFLNAWQEKMDELKVPQSVHGFAQIDRRLLTLETVPNVFRDVLFEARDRGFYSDSRISAAEQVFEQASQRFIDSARILDDRFYKSTMHTTLKMPSTPVPEEFLAWTTRQNAWKEWAAEIRAYLVSHWNHYEAGIRDIAYEEPPHEYPDHP